MKIYKKVIVYSLLIITIPLFILSATFFMRTRWTVEGEVLSSYRSAVGIFVNNLAAKSKSYEGLVQTLMTAGSIGEMLSRDGPISPEYLRAGKTLDETIGKLYSMEMRSEVYMVSIYGENEQAAIVSDNIVHYRLLPPEEAGELERIRKEAIAPIYTVSKTSGLGRNVITILAPIIGYDEATLFSRNGVIRIDILADVFLANTVPQSTKGSDFGTYVFTASGAPVFARPIAGSTAAEVWKTVSRIDQWNPGEIMVQRSGEGLLLIPGNELMGLKFCFLFPIGELEEKITATLFQAVLLYVGIVAVFILISINLTMPYKRRLGLLIDKINTIKRGDLSNDALIGGADEIGLVDGHLTEMVARLRELLATVYKEEIELKEARLTALESQINPHFLFNTLEVINSIAEVYDNQRICSITERLGRMLRYSLDSSSPHLAPLEDEFANVRDYLAIYEVRFEGSFESSLRLDPDCAKAPVPRFILQPLAENSIRHGFADAPNGARLSISAVREGESLRIEVEDNGGGMDEDRRMELERFMSDIIANRNVYPKRGVHIGLKNVFSRLELTYRETFRMSIESEKGAGTKISIIMPMRILEAPGV